MSKIRDASIEISFKEFNDRAQKSASVLSDIGVKPLDRVAIMLRNEITFLEVSAAVDLLGAAVVPVNWHNTLDELEYLVNDSSAKVLVIHADLLKKLGHVEFRGTKTLVVKTPGEVCDAYGLDRSLGELPKGCLDWASLRDDAKPFNGPAQLPPPVIFYTSGTTGRPKGVMRPPPTPESSRAMFDCLSRSYGFGGDHGTGAEIVTVVTGPMYHGSPNGHANMARRIGADITIMPRFEAEQLLSIIQERGVTHLNLVPIMMNRMLRLPEGVRTRYDLSSLRFVAHAAAPISRQIKHAMIDWLGPVINEFYGATELGNVAFCSSNEWLEHPGTVGKAPEGYVIKIIGPDGAPLPAGEVGEIACKIPGFQRISYMNDEAKTAEIEIVSGLISAGDVGYLDDDGFLFICDRNKDMIISGGVNIYPAQIEGALHAMPGVSDCAVFGIPDDEFGEAIHAVVEPRDGVEIDQEAVRRYLRGVVPGYMVPKTVDISRNLPREDTGKIFKRKLRDAFWANANRLI